MAPKESLATKSPGKVPNLQRFAQWLPLAVLTVGLLLTYKLWTREHQIVARDLRANFDFLVQEDLTLIKQRMQAYEQVLRGARGLFTASESVERHEFRDYVTALGLEESYRGIQGVGFTQIVPAARLQSHIESVRKEGFPDYAIWPDREQEIHTSIIYLEPFSGRNLRAFGYDMFSEQVRHAAMVRARDTGTVALSGKVRLVQETGEREQAGVLSYLPIYANGKRLDSVQSRRSAIIGWVYSPFRMDDLMAGLFGGRANEIDIEIYDGEEISEKTLLHDSDKIRFAGVMEAPLLAIKRMEIAGRLWTVAFRSLPPFEKRLKSNQAGYVAVTGIVLSLLLTAITRLLARGRSRAMEAREALAIKQKQLEDLNLSLEQRVAERTAELERLNRELESFCYSISHEIQAPIARLDGFSTAIAESARDAGSDEVLYLAERLGVASRKLRDVIDSLLVIYRLGSTEMEMVPVDLSQLCGQILDELREHERTIKVTIAPDVVVQGDHRMLETCIRHLLENAVKYSARNPEAAVEFGEIIQPGEAVYFVRDNGVGFDMAFAGKLFEPFCRLHCESEFEGSGTGLPTVQRIIERHGGRIWAEATPGNGATFFFTLG
ncbi:CHASE domain-containing protein [Geobacter grbiciae]|uniref:CHASE domain-containing protein n=1 Tax=Geobacter grbiciae TaxID=155042 RepID=UPI001C0104BA|nr:CHASE domain-containing protein [Geobacter grbiciae]MBT1076658.1 CHASE domain-containing protein [Geobacter grbiciae]